MCVKGMGRGVRVTQDCDGFLFFGRGGEGVGARMYFQFERL